MFKYLKMTKFYLIISVILLLGCSNNQQDNNAVISNLNKINTEAIISYEDMVNGFHQLPNEVRMKSYWLWLNGMVTKESITSELEGMKSKGYGGAVICDALAYGKNSTEVPHGPDFASDEWLDLLSHAVGEGDRLDMVLSLNVQSGWNMGGPTVLPSEAMKKLVFTEQKFEGSQKIAVKFATPDTLLFYEDITIQAFKTGAGTLLEWGLKSFDESIGAKGIYPLEKYQEIGPISEKDNTLAKNKIIDLTPNFKDGLLEWEVPEGDWTVVRYGMTCTGKRPRRPSENADGLCLDHLSKDALDSYYRQVMQPIIKVALEAGSSLKYLHTDSWEMKVVNWTNDFKNEFKNRRGYDPFIYLPVMTNKMVGSREESNRFLYDLRLTVGDLVAENHYKYFAKISHKHGLLMHPESGGPHAAPIDGMHTMSFNDELMGEFWARSNTHRIAEAERLTVKQSASVAHTNGKRFVTAEGPTSMGPQWERSPKDVKGVIDRVFCAGVNKIIWHTFSASPKEFGKPGNSYFAGTHLNLNATWWEQSNTFIEYLNRCSYLLSLGHFKSDVLCYYGSGVPNFVFMKNEYKELDFGYDWDKCSRDVLMNRVSFDGEKIVLPDGMNYRLLVLPEEESIDLDVLKKVEKLVKAGLNVIGPRPIKATGLTNYPESDMEVEEIVEKMWGNINGTTITENSYGKGRVIWGVDVNEVLAKMNIQPDFGFNSIDKSTGLDYIHRKTNKQDIYFVVNRHARKGINDFEYRYLNDLPNRYEQVECKFKVTGKVPELWDPLSGEISKIYAYREESGYTIIPLHFKPEGSKFIIFREAAKNAPHITKINKDGKSFFPGNVFEAWENPYIRIFDKEGEFYAQISEVGEYELIWSDGKKSTIKAENAVVEYPISGSWSLSFAPEWGGPEKVVVDELKSWTEFADRGIKYYSGTVTYTKTFPLSKKDIMENRVLLDLGNVREMASIKINGKQLPVKWCAPFVFDITKYAKAGKNDLEVEVVNLWPNRLILDGRLPEEKRLTKTNINKFEAKDAEKYLRFSGLLGPVRLKLTPTEVQI
jgi:hypothetical protein